MGSVQLSLPGGVPIKDGGRVTLVGSQTGLVTLPITNKQVDIGNLAPNWVQVPRPGLVEAPFIIKGPRNLRTVTLNLTLVNSPDITGSIETLLSKLSTLATDESIQMAYGGFESSSVVTQSGSFVCTGFDPTITERDPDTNVAIQATAKMELTEANPPPALSGASATTTLPTNSATNTGPSVPPIIPTPKARLSSYIFQSGDTMASISQTVYGTPAYGTAIMDANGITDARQLNPGVILSIPGSSNVSTSFA